jgi:hypothetical protein
LAEPRCPECGYRFTWDDLRDPAKRLHPYLFEHHPDRNAWSFLNTLLGGLWPREFWATLYPTQPSRPARLFAYWLLTAVPLVAIAATHFYFLHHLAKQQLMGFGRAFPAENVIRFTADMDARAGGYAMLALLVVAWPWVTLAALMSFQVSLRRARLKPSHVLRCVVYSGDLSLWLVIPIGGVIALAYVMRPGGPFVAHPLPVLADYLPPLILAVLVYRLICAYRLYLKFEHAVATVLASQVIVLLLYWKVLLVAGGF